LAVALVVGVPLCYYALILDWQNRPYCHKQIYSSFLGWMHERKTTAFPNVSGQSSNSLAEIDEQMAGSSWSRNYNYVPGLQQDDPGDFVLMYMKDPTRWTWHGSPPTVFRHRKWILVPVDFKTASHLRAGAGPGELSERVSLDELRNRLKRTLEFVRTNERPNWHAVVAEHERFLESLEHGNR
jgi:hypothetical protein